MSVSRGSDAGKPLFLLNQMITSEKIYKTCYDGYKCGQTDINPFDEY
ncbi:hypothetical protein [Inconstantimicrobium mannanitabidum]|uniref:Uncharacterized protein n=1 Tax=Inconstantimicrobium mannanitabidum TaxID=1604901 RepID=A0ACB5R8G2_9CLOT|nr:hypothetical protein [Clostridium sp. TW13]GKX65154.1 hypothetical protein rsdtw13_04120 [Clostridium sp. TW13]